MVVPTVVGLIIMLIHNIISQISFCHLLRKSFCGCLTFAMSIGIMHDLKAIPMIDNVTSI